jgi:DNA-binding MarR family transcriptional regulator
MNKDRFDVFSNCYMSAAKSITRLKEKGMAPYGLSSVHTRCIRCLYAFPEGQTRTQIAKYCGVDKAQISRIIGELYEKSYITDNQAKSGYKNKIMLTESGREVADRINDLILKINQFVSGDIPDDQIKVFYEVFEQICENLKNAEAELDLNELCAQS